MAVWPQIKMQARKTARMTQEQQSPASGALARWITIGNATGAPVADRTNIMTGGPRGWPVTPLLK
jgi:hypothetical protein